MKLIHNIKQRIAEYCYIYTLNKTEDLNKREWSLFISSFKFLGDNYNITKPCRILNPEFISIGDHFFCEYDLRLEAITFFEGINYTPEITIGHNVSINAHCHIGAINKVIIGSNVLIASKVYISDHSHGKIISEELKTPPNKRILHSKGAVIIKDNVWIGEGVCILPGVTIGENSIIGANSVVNRDVPANTVVGGIPAKTIRSL